MELSEGALSEWIPLTFKAFGTDPDWTKAKTASEVNGALTVQGGVKSVFLTATDYSPIK